MKQINFGVFISLFFLASCGIQTPWMHNKIQYSKHSSTETARIDKQKVIHLDNEESPTVSGNADAMPTPFVTSISQKDAFVNHPEKTMLNNPKKVIITPKKEAKQRIISQKVEKQVVMKEKKQLLSSQEKNDTQLILEVILCFLLPPLAVFLHEGKNWTTRCTINLILCLLFVIPGVLHALYVVLAT